MTFEIEKFLAKIKNAGKQKSSSLILQMDEAELLALEIKQLQLAFEILVDNEQRKSAPPRIANVDGSTF